MSTADVLLSYKTDESIDRENSVVSRSLFNTESFKIDKLDLISLSS